MNIKDHFNSYQEDCRKLYSLSAEDERQIIESLPPAKYSDFVYNRIDYVPDAHDFLIDSYNEIKDDSWPECNSYEDLRSLPDHIIEECRDMHGFDFLIWEEDVITKERWDKIKSESYPVTELIKYKNTVLDVKEYIQGKKIVDFAGHAGFTSLVCLHNGAKSAVSTNIRPEFVKIAQECLKLSDYNDRFEAVVADIHDYDTNTKLSADSDTVLLYGIMYHVHDHVAILESITKAKPKHIIIDSDIPDEILDQEQPLISWYTEDSEFIWNGVNGDQKEIWIGHPNEKWFDITMEFLGYTLVTSQRYKGSKFDSYDVNKLYNKSVMVYQLSK